MRTRKFGLPFILGALLFSAIPAAFGAATEFYVVQKNDTLSSIARDHQCTPSELLRCNELRNGNLVRAGQKIRVPVRSELADLASDSSRDSYVVQRGDRLEDIARRFGVSRIDLCKCNGIDNGDHILTGQRLSIPGKKASGSGASLRINPDLKRDLDRISVQPGRWKYIVVHHSGEPQGTPKGMDEYHRLKRHMENGLAYHFVIGNGHGMEDGSIFVGARWSHQIDGGHLASEELNHEAIGICLVGNFDSARPTEAQLKSLAVLTQYLMQQCNLKQTALKIHREINTKPTDCPGKNFTRKAFLATLLGR